MPTENVIDVWLAGIVTLVGTVTGLPAGTERSTTIGRSPAGERVSVAVVARAPADSLTVDGERVRPRVGTSLSVTVTSPMLAVSPGVDAVNA